MNYFTYNGVLYHCDKVFSWIAIDKDGTATLFQKRPIARVEEGFWCGGLRSLNLHLKKPDIVCPTWLDSLQKCTG